MKTEDLKKVLKTFTDVIKFVNIRPITDLVEIYSKDGVAHFGCTDNITTIVATIENDNDFENVVVSLSTLYKLVKLTSKETVKLTNKTKYLEFVGDGKYKIPIQLDESGNDIYLHLEMPSLDSPSHYKFDDIDKSYHRNKVGIFDAGGSDDYSILPFKNYCNKDNMVITSDSMLVAVTKDVNLFDSNIKDFVMEHIYKLGSDVDIEKVDSGYRVSSDIYNMYIVDSYKDVFPIDMVKPYIVTPSENESFYVSCKLSNNTFKSAIKRLNVFNGAYDTPSIVLSFNSDGVVLENSKKTSEEVINISDLCCNKDITIELPIGTMLEALKTMEDSITMYAGESFICLEDSIGFYIISAIE